MKKIKLFFLTFLSVFFGLTSFSNAFNIDSAGIDYLDSIALSSGSFTNAYLPLLYEIPNPSSDDIRNLCVVFKNFDRSSDFGRGLRYADSVALSSVAPFYESPSPYSLYCVSGRRGKFFINWNTASNRVSADNYRVFEADYIGGLFSSSDCSQDSNYLQCLEDKNQLIGQVSTLSGSLSSCQSDLSDCRGGQDASLLACIDQKEQCESSLTTLSGNYASLENMNSSLSSQLQECLENASNSTGDLICNKFDLFRSSDNTNYSFPINNDLILPPGYKGFVNEGVLAIKQDSSLDSAYSIDDEEFQDVIDSYGIVFLYMFGSALFLVFIYMIRKYFIGLKS